MADKQTGFLDLPGGIKLYYETCGAGKPIVMLHAGIADHRMWAGQCSELSKHFRVITPDLRGYGKSTTKEAPYRFCDDVYLLIRHLGLRTVSLVGCSLGGRTVLDLMITHPEVVERALLVAPGLRGYQYTDFETLAKDAAVEKLVAEGKIEDAVDSMTDLWVAGLNRNRKSVDAEAWELVRRMIIDNYEAVMHRFPEAGIDFNMISSLGGIKVPPLVMIGDKDLPDMQEVSRIVSEKIPGAERQVIRDAAHLPNLEHAELFNKSVTDYFGRES